MPDKTRLYEFVSGIETSTQPDAGTPTDPNDLVTKSYADGLSAGSAGFVVSGSFGSPVAITASGTISFTAGNQRTKKYIQGSGGAQSAGSIQVGTIEGQELLLIGCSDTNTVTIDSGAPTSTTNVITNGAIVLGANSYIMLNWDNGQSKWVEDSRNA